MALAQPAEGRAEAIQEVLAKYRQRVSPDLKGFLERKLETNDLRVVGGFGVRAQIQGVRVRDREQPPSQKDIFAYLNIVLTNEQKERFSKRKSIDFADSSPAFGRVRVNAAHSADGVVLSVRYLPHDIPVFDNLGLPPVLGEWVHRPNGIIFVIGTTGSGKSTTEAALGNLALAKLNDPIIWTLEDPIEYRFRDDRVSQREFGRHFVSWGEGIEDAMREKPDIIVIGECRSKETVEAMLAAGESGHLVICTGHAKEPAALPEKLCAYFDAGERDLIRLQLATLTVGIVMQKLVPHKDPTLGRRAACEILLNDDTTAMAILQGGATKALRDHLTNGGVKANLPLERHLIDLYKTGEITWDTVRAAANYPSRLQGVT